MINSELKTFANTEVKNLLFEAAVFYNFKPRAFHRFSVGIGINGEPSSNYNIINAITIPAQLEIYPLQQFKKLSIIFELTPEFIFEDKFSLRSLWGIRHTFGEQIKKDIKDVQQTVKPLFKLLINKAKPLKNIS